MNQTETPVLKFLELHSSEKDKKQTNAIITPSSGNYAREKAERVQSEGKRFIFRLDGHEDF